MNIVFVVAWIAATILLAVRFMRPNLVKNISYGWILFAVIMVHVLYGVFVTWGQYHLWATTTDPRVTYFLSAPLAHEAPLPSVLEWSRSFFEKPLGYFWYYSFGRIWLNIIMLFIVSLFFYTIFKLWSIYRGGFIVDGPEIILTTLLIAGYPGVLVLVPLSFILAFAYFGVSYLKNRELGIQPMYIEPSFIVVAPIALIFGSTILRLL